MPNIFLIFTLISAIIILILEILNKLISNNKINNYFKLIIKILYLVIIVSSSINLFYLNN